MRLPVWCRDRCIQKVDRLAEVVVQTVVHLLSEVLHVHEIRAENLVNNNENVYVNDANH